MNQQDILKGDCGLHNEESSEIQRIIDRYTICGNMIEEEVYSVCEVGFGSGIGYQEYFKNLPVSYTGIDSIEDIEDGKYDYIVFICVFTKTYSNEYEMNDLLKKLHSKCKRGVVVNSHTKDSIIKLLKHIETYAQSVNLILSPEDYIDEYFLKINKY